MRFSWKDVKKIKDKFNLKDFAMLTDEASQGTHRGNDGRDAEALQALVGWLTFLPAHPSGSNHTGLLRDVAQFNARQEWKKEVSLK